MTRAKALEQLKYLSKDTLELIALVVETAEIQHDYLYNGYNEYKVDCGQDTLDGLANEFRSIKCKW